MSFDNSTKVIKLNKVIIGTWEYRYSFIGDSTFRMNNGNPFPAQKIIFRECDDEIDFKKFAGNDRLTLIRKENILRNVCSEKYNGDTLIESTFPFAYNMDPGYTIVDHGYAYKDNYDIRKITKDSLVIWPSEVYKVNGKDITEISHIYIRKR